MSPGPTLKQFLLFKNTPSIPIWFCALLIYALIFGVKIYYVYQHNA